MSIRWMMPVALLLCAVSAHSEPAAPPSDAAARPGAAETVQEGSVDQWLQHYQRERGEHWPQSRQVESNADADADPDQPKAPSSNAAEQAPTTR